MIGSLPTSLTVNGNEYKIRSDFRVGILILQAFMDDNLTRQEAITIMLQCLYEDYDNIPVNDLTEAAQQAVWFLNCGDTIAKPQTHAPLYNFEQDEQMIFSAINKVAGKEVRALDYLHFWTFIGYFNELEEGTFSTVLSIRSKKQKGKKLEKWEKEFYNNNKELVNLKHQYTDSEQEDIEALEELLGLK